MTYAARLDAVIHEATREYLMLGHRPTDFDSDGIELDWDGLEGFIRAMTRTPMGRFNYMVEHDLCPWHSCDFEICRDDQAMGDECAAFWDLIISGPEVQA